MQFKSWFESLEHLGIKGKLLKAINPRWADVPVGTPKLGHIYEYSPDEFKIDGGDKWFAMKEYKEDRTFLIRTRKGAWVTEDEITPQNFTEVDASRYEGIRYV
jgi:hypothetical protein